MRSFTLIYYGWFVLAASALTDVLAIGSTSYGAGLFVLPLQSEFHISRVAANSSLIVLYIGAAIFSPMVGRALDRYSIRLVVSAGAVSLASALIAIALTPYLWLMGLMLFFPAAIGFSALGPLKTQTLAARWFERRRGLALGLSAGAAGGGGVFVVPLLSQAIQRFGWRMSMLYEGLAIGVIVIVLALLVFQDEPSDPSWGADLERQKRYDGVTARSGASLRWKDVFSRSAFWMPSLTLAFISGASQAAVITLVPYGVQLGFKAISAAGFVSAFAVAAGATKVTAGLLADRMNQRFLLAAAASFMTLCWLLLGFSTTYGAIFTAGCLAGAALGCALPTTAGLIAASFGPAYFGRVMGWTYTLNLSFGIAGILLVGALYDLTGFYRVAFRMFAWLSALLLTATVIFSRKVRKASLDTSAP